MTSLLDVTVDRVCTAAENRGPGPGMSLAVVATGEGSRCATFGVADSLTNQPVTEHTAFALGSVSKVITATATIRIAGRGAFDLDAPIRSYLGWFDVPDRVTARHLLNHTAGLPAFIDTLPPSRLAAWKAGRRPKAPVGERFHYSNMGYLALGYALEAATGVEYPAIVATEVLEPLGMVDAAGRVSADAAKLAYGHFQDNATGAYRPFPRRPFVGGHASVCASAKDMALFTAQLAGGRKGADLWLGEAGFARLTRPTVDTGDDGTGYAMGLFTRGPGPDIVFHGGENEGYESALIADLRRGLGVAVLVNSFDDPWPMARFALDTMRAVADHARLPDPPPRGRELPVRPRRLPPPESPHGAICGSYRSHAPLLTDYRVFERQGEMILESNGLFESSLVEINDTTFRIGVAGHEFAVFDVLVDGRAQRATIGGGTYARVEDDRPDPLDLVGAP